MSYIYFNQVLFFVHRDECNLDIAFINKFFEPPRLHSVPHLERLRAMLGFSSIFKLLFLFRTISPSCLELVTANDAATDPFQGKQ